MRHWTPEARARQAALIRSVRPWARSTGPRTALGKAISSRNALKHGAYAREMKMIRAYLIAQRSFLRQVRWSSKKILFSSNELLCAAPQKDAFSSRGGLHPPDFVLESSHDD
ncbi:MAG: hypothetical protein WC043_06410 [Pseudobdellovibrionaceae bacterium]